MATIKAPNEAYNGQIGDVVFKDGVAETDNQAVITYCRGAGYEVDGKVDNPAARPARLDSSVTQQLLGTRLRDAAVNPHAGDFLPPINAGDADPHGPEVVSPEIHGAPGPTPLVPGVVSDDPNVQQLRESESAGRVLIDQEPVGDVVADMAQVEQPVAPAGNASQEAWADWVIATHPDLGADMVRGKKRDELRDQYGPAEQE